MAINIKSVSLRNFLSVGAVTQTINLNRNGITLVLGENLDMGGNGSRNGVGKCLGKNTIVKLRNPQTNEVFEITLGDLYNAAKSKNNKD
jgi:hypothetical protein